MSDLVKGKDQIHQITFVAVYVLALFTFTAFSLSALHHILISIPGVYFFVRYLRCGKVEFSLSMWSLLAMILISLLSLMVNDVEFVIKKAFKLKYYFFALLCVFACRAWWRYHFSIAKIRLFINTFLVSTTLASISGLIAFFWGFNPLRWSPPCHTERACGMYGMYMSYGYGIAFFIVILIGLWLYREKLELYFSKKLLYLAILVNLVGLYYSFDRGAWIGLIVALPFFFFKQNKRKFVAVFGLVALAVSLAYLFIPQIHDLAWNYKRVYSVDVRMSLYQTALRVAQEYPVLGIGYRNFEPNVSRLKEMWGIGHSYFAGNAHNNFLEQLASTGILGLLALLCFHIFWAWEIYKRQDCFSQILLPFVVVLFITGQVQATLWDGENLFFIMLVYALSQLSGKKEETR